jgi:hypothetical protein
MDYLGIVKIAEKKLPINQSNVIDDLKNLISQGSTGGEISSMVGKYLKDLEFNNREVFLILKDEISQYLLLCKKHGLNIL